MTVRTGSATVSTTGRVTATGKFLFDGTRKLYVRGVTYGTFRPDQHGHEFPAPERVADDFSAMRADGINAVRTYTAPPRWLLDLAQLNGLRVMVGLAGERYVGHLNDRNGARTIAEIVRGHVAGCAGHPAILCYAVANEIPSALVRWFGRRRTERLIAQLCAVVRREDEHALVTYVNYPSTEYLQPPSLDLLAYNVYLESPERLAAYLARLQNIAGRRPLLMAEIGLDSIRNGEQAQADSLATQTATAFASGCAGAFVYAWTDEWHRGGEDVHDWAFGITRRDRSPKPALAAVREAFAAVPFSPALRWPRVSVVVCSYNGARTLRSCLDGLRELDYPDYEVIVVDDGSTDGTADVAAAYPFRLISTENRGLSCARNTGLDAADGKIVAYIDDDARPDRDWLRYLVATFDEGDWAAVGGPNLAPPDRPVAECVANAPGGPIHVLLSDREAEHIPGCNMAFRRSALLEVGGFDPRFHVAGDDVDVCWRLQERGLKVGFSPAAVVWHRRRPSVRAYLRQQKGYGAAEALLARKWPQKYSHAGHIAWRGRLYGEGLTRHLAGARRWRVYYGSQGSGLFQSLYQPAPQGAAALLLMPEWHLVIGVLAALALLGVTWAPLLYAAAPLLALAAGAVAVQAVRSAAAAEFPTPAPSVRQALARRALVAVLHVLQPAARLHGRLRHGIRPWRWTANGPARLPVARTWGLWCTRWTDPQRRLQALEQQIAATGARIVRGGDFDRWDFEVRVGMVVRARVRMAVEEHARRAQLVRLHASLRHAAAPLLAGALLAALAVAAALAHARFTAAVLTGLVAVVVAWVLVEAAVVAGVIHHAVTVVDASGSPIKRARRRGSAAVAGADRRRRSAVPARGARR